MDNTANKKRTACVLPCSNTKSQPPVDHGWAWFVMLGATVNVMVLMVFLRASSLLFIQFLDIYQASATMTTLVFALSSTTFSVSNILAATVLLPRYDVRTLGIIGALVNFVSTIGIAFAPNIAVVNIMFAIVGFAHGLIVVPQLTLLGHYFKRHLSLATATTTMGISLATIFGTPLTQVLLDIYDVRGTILLLAGVTLHCVPASLLLRPVSFYSASPFSVHPQDEDVAEKSSSGVLNNIFYDKNRDSMRQGDKAPFLVQNNKLNHKREVIVEEDKNETSNSEDQCKEDDQKSSSTIETSDKDICTPRLLQKMPPPRIRSVSESWHVLENKMNNHRHLYGKNDIFMEYSDTNGSTVLGRKASSAGVKTSLSNILSASIRYLGDTSSFYGSSVSQIHHIHTRGIETRSVIDLGHNQAEISTLFENASTSSSESEISVKKRGKSFFCRLKRLASQSVFTHPVGLLILLASGLGIHTQAGVAYMPATGIENGCTEEQVPFLMTAVGVADVVSKLCMGFLADTGIIKRIHVACLSQLTIGLLFQLVPVFQGFILMILLQALIGFTVGVFHMLVPVITVDLLGVQHMGHIMAGYMLINGFTNAIDHLVVGSLSDLTGSFYGAYHYMGSLTLMSVAMLLSQPLVERCLTRSSAEATV
ncbi:monocarboxylate transporter [Plakobranchus ocellatus]|uniref:Monocarboxylate transporter n=1 Tax=Plakobranchus ocellatus TaxID=259542 RepID=A0AAV4CQX4_9GAST|nr:monocarboxylate transporter [Plakobranchus ocellatus]